MKKQKSLGSKIAEGGVYILIFVILIVLAYGASWIATCGIIKLITMCFGLTFKWSIATGVWLIMCLTKTVFKITVEK